MKTFIKIILMVALLLSNSVLLAQIDLECNGRDMHSIYLLNTPSGFYRIDSVR